MKKLQNILISTRTMAVLLLVYAVSMAYATFVENDYGTPTAKALIYEAKWFELLMLLLIINFVGNIARYRLWRREKWATLVFHLAFILIFIGGAITRYISYEGQMHIREGETSREIITDRNYFKIQAEEHGDVQTFQEVPHKVAAQDFWLSKLLYRPYHAIYQFNDKKIEITQTGYIQRKKDSLIADPNGTEYLHFVSAGQRGRENFFIKSGEAKSVNGTLVSYNRPIEGAVEFKSENGNLFIKTPVDASFMTMATQATGTTKMNEYQPLALRSLYTINDLRIVVPEGLRKGKLIYFEGDKRKDKDVPDLMTVEVKGPKSKQTVELPVEKGNANSFKQISLDGMNVILGFGPKVITTPFNIKLEKFVMETYPGSSSPSAYESHVQIIDKGKQTPYNIFMNHVLDYDGYRFFQSSFDPDRKGTVLSVNHDFWGTLLSYIGYFFLFVGMFVTFFWKGSHFWNLTKNLKSIYNKNTVAALLLLFSLGLNAQEIDMHGTDGSHNHAAENNANIQQTAPATSMKPRIISADEIISKNHISEEHAEKFGYLLVQNVEGRIVPMNTQAIDILRKLTKRDAFKGSDGKSYTADQLMLSVITNAVASKFTSTMPVWAQVPIIKIGDNGGEKLREKAKANAEGFTSLLNLMPMDSQGNIHYLLENDYNTAFRKKASEQDNYDHEVIAVNERVQIMNELLSGELTRFVPEKNDGNHRWNLWMNDKMEENPENITLTLPYFLAVMDATKSGNWQNADAELQKLIDYQQKWGKAVVPAENKVDLEVFLNKVNINFKLLIFYTILGGLLLILGFIELFKPKRSLQKIIKILIWIGIVGYIFHFLGLIARWYISGHAPWSNGYEAIIFISWVGISAGLLFYFGFSKKSNNPQNLVKKSANALIPAAGFMVAVIMMGFAHGGSALDPQITPLVPVLKSYWLIVHVAIIVSSYGFFALSMVIAIIVLFFYIIASRKSYEIHQDSTLKELTIVSEMSLMIGLFTLTVGNFLGGIWANESWGRYWSWDPKETWAFISIMVYAFVVHMRLVPGLRGRWAFHVAAMFAFCSMVMTYFGVNYYLSGLHSYAKGDPVPVPIWVYLGLAFMVALSAISFFRYKKLKENK